MTLCRGKNVIYAVAITATLLSGNNTLAEIPSLFPKLEVIDLIDPSTYQKIDSANGTEFHSEIMSFSLPTDAVSFLLYAPVVQRGDSNFTTLFELKNPDGTDLFSQQPKIASLEPGDHSLMLVPKAPKFGILHYLRRVVYTFDIPKKRQ